MLDAIVLATKGAIICSFWFGFWGLVVWILASTALEEWAAWLYQPWKRSHVVVVVVLCWVLVIVVLINVSLVGLAIRDRIWEMW